METKQEDESLFPELQKQRPSRQLLKFQEEDWGSSGRAETSSLVSRIHVLGC